MNWITSWLRDRDWANLQANATVTMGVLILIGAVMLIIYGLSQPRDTKPEDICYRVEASGAYFSKITFCEIELPNGVQCYAVEFGDGGGLYCD